MPLFSSGICQPAKPLGQRIRGRHGLRLAARVGSTARGANPNAVVLLAELDPFPGNGGANDLEFLKLIYNAGGSCFFDIVAARVDGGAYPV